MLVLFLGVMERQIFRDFVNDKFEYQHPVRTTPVRMHIL